MRGKNTVVINGRLYDAVTGLPISKAQPQTVDSLSGPRAMNDVVVRRSSPSPRLTPATQHTHRKVQKSQTLYRATLKRPVAQSAPSSTRSPLITRFGSTAPSTKPAPPPSSAARVAPIERAPQPQAAPQLTAQQQSQALKKQLIRDRIAEAEAAKKISRGRKRGLRGFARRQPKLVSIATITMALLLLGGYITYTNLSTLSVRVAAARAGINASFPGYQVDGYAMNGPCSRLMARRHSARIKFKRLPSACSERS